MSPRKKKVKLSPIQNNLKRESNAEELPCKRENSVKTEEVPCKRTKSVKTEEDELKARKKKNFIEACRQVSCRAYSDYRARLLLYYQPSCMKNRECKHNDKNYGIDIKEMPSYAKEAFIIEIKNNIWYEALEVCEICIPEGQYLSANILQEVVEIMLNVHEDELSEYTASYIIDRCQQILSLHFTTHPPCVAKSDLRKCYSSFLRSPMDLKEKTLTNRVQYDCKSGIVQYCMNRLENEISIDSQDGPLFNKSEKIPEEMKQSVKGLHWQKEKFEIFELLYRPDRIERLMAVLESIIELLQFDLGIWHSRHATNLSRHIIRSNKPIMAFVLWSDNTMYTGAFTANCRQIVRLFVNLIHLEYPNNIIKIISTWLNTMIQTFYVCELNSNIDYPNTQKYCTSFAREFYKMISEMPYKSVNRILERIEPAFMRHLIGMRHIQKLTGTNNDCIITILINFFKESEWRLYAPDDTDVEISEKLFFKPKKIKRIINYVIKKCANETEEKMQYAKLDKKELKYLKPTTDFNLNHLVHTLYITLEAHLDTYDIQSVEETWNMLNEQILDDSQINSQTPPENSSYLVTEASIKKYKHIMQATKELQTVFRDVKNSEDFPDMLEIFTNIDLLAL